MILAVIGIVVITLLFAVVFGVIGGIPVMFLWNWLMPAIFGLPTISLWQAIGLSILFKSSSSSSNSKD